MESNHNPESEFKNPNVPDTWNENVQLHPNHSGFKEALKTFFEKRPKEGNPTKPDLWNDQSIQLLSDQETEEMLKTVIIEGDRLGLKRLTSDILLQEGLGPKFKLKDPDDPNTEVFVSIPYNHGRQAYVGFVKKDGKVTANTYYKSDSHKIWRYLPDYEFKNGEVSFYGKGAEEGGSVDLPFFIQKALDTISKNVASSICYRADLVFAGTARRSNRLFARKSRYYKEVSSKPVLLEGNFYSGKNNQKIPPEQLVFRNPNQEPDFSKLIASWGNSDTMFEIFPSKDGKLRFIFGKSITARREERAWVAGVELVSPITSTGVRHEWINAGDLTTPLKGYQFFFDPETKRWIDESGGYGEIIPHDNSYVSLYSNYVSKIPTIVEYLERIPSKDFI